MNFKWTHPLRCKLRHHKVGYGKHCWVTLANELGVTIGLSIHWVPFSSCINWIPSQNKQQYTQHFCQKLFDWCRLSLQILVGLQQEHRPKNRWLRNR